MNTELDKRAVLRNVMETMNDSDILQMLAFAAGYEAGKASQISSNIFETSYNLKKFTSYQERILWAIL